MSSRTITLCAALFLILASIAVGQETLSAYKVLELYNFPAGLLPEGVTGYEINMETGEFVAYLPGTCSFPVESYTLKYKTTISGVISKNKITNLKGVSVKVLLLWLNIVEVRRDGDELQFSVGIASANFEVENFLESPKCGCGFDCVTAAVGGGGGGQRFENSLGRLFTSSYF